MLHMFFLRGARGARGAIGLSPEVTGVSIRAERPPHTVAPLGPWPGLAIDLQLNIHLGSQGDSVTVSSVTV